MTGRGYGDDHGSNVASLDEARRRAADKAKAERRASGGRSVRDIVIGGAMVAMAAGFLVSLVVPLVRG